jgi:hypothetical protein
MWWTGGGDVRPRASAWRGLLLHQRRFDRHPNADTSNTLKRPSQRILRLPGNGEEQRKAVAAISQVLWGCSGAGLASGPSW